MGYYKYNPLRYITERPITDKEKEELLVQHEKEREQVQLRDLLNTDNKKSLLGFIQTKDGRWISDRLIEDIFLDEARIRNGMKRSGIQTLSQLVSLTKAEISSISYFGMLSVYEIEWAMNDMKIELKEE